MNIRRWDVWVHPTRDDMVLHRPVGGNDWAITPIESVHMDNFIKQAATRGGARIYLEQKGQTS